MASNMDDLVRKNTELRRRNAELEQATRGAVRDLLKRAAIGRGVDPEQVEAFILLHEEGVRLGRDRVLETTTGQPVETWIDSKLEGDGAMFRLQGNRQTEHVDDILAAMGLGEPRSSKLDRLMGDAGASKSADEANKDEVLRTMGLAGTSPKYLRSRNKV